MIAMCVPHVCICEASLMVPPFQIDTRLIVCPLTRHEMILRCFVVSYRVRSHSIDSFSSYSAVVSGTDVYSRLSMYAMMFHNEGNVYSV